MPSPCLLPLFLGCLTQQVHVAPAGLEREKPLLLGAAGPLLPETGQVGPFADLDGDGDPDLLHASGLWHGNGFGLFRRVRGLDLPGEERIAFLQADADGLLDLLTRTHLHLGDGAGGFLEASASLPTGFVADAALVEDLDGDGDADLLAVERRNHPAPERIWLALNDGSGTFADASAGLPATPARAWTAAAGDVDGDLDLDLVIAASQGGNELWLNDGAAGFTSAPGALPASDFTRALALADLDGDLAPDLVLGNDGYWGPASRVLAGDGAGGFVPVALPVASGLRRTEAVLVLDLELDGDPDLLLLDSFWIASTGGPALMGEAADRLLVNDGTGGFVESLALPATRGKSRAGFAGDLDGDLDPDVVIDDEVGATRLLLNDGQGGLVEARPARVALSQPVHELAPAVALGDLDGDGLLDVFRPLGALRNGPPGVLVPLAVSLPALPSHCLDDLARPVAADVALGDVDGDGDLDAYLAGPGLGFCGPEQSNRLWIRASPSAFTDETATRLPGGWIESDGTPRQVELLELDGDGDLDAACVRAKDLDVAGVSSCYRNDGSGVFTRAGALGGTASWGALGDLDGDGDADYLEGGDGHGNHVYANDGAAVFAWVPGALPAQTLPRHARGCALGDLDQDGDLDAYVVDEPVPSAHVYVNDGHAGFTDEPWRMTASPEGDLSFTDLDLDGAPELVSSTRLFRNDGRGRFRELELVRALGAGSNLAVGDLDLDGDPDLVSVDPTGMSLATGLLRHLEAHGPARLGKRLVLTVHGPPRTPYTLLESLGTLRAPLGSLGWLLVDPSRIVGVTSGFLDGRGEAPYRRALPASPALLGATSHWQAFVGTPAHGTNLVTTRIGSL